MIWTNPYNVPDDSDLIQPTDVVTEKWSENVLFWLHDGAQGISLYAHMSIISAVPRLVEGVVAIMLPNGRTLLHRSVGLCDTQGVMSSGPMTVECLQPNRRWRLKLDAVLQETDDAAIAGGTDFGDFKVPVSLDITFDAVHPVWSFGEGARDQQWFHLHVEQGGRMMGSLRHGETRLWLDCPGFRDHSHGPRDYSGLQGFSWAMGVFPSGRTFMAMRIWTDAQPRLVSRGYVADGQHIRRLEADEMPILRRITGEPHDITVAGTVDGTPFSVTGQTLRTIGLHFLRPIGNLFGWNPADSKTPMDVHCPTRFEWDGEVGYGWLDRVMRVEYLTGAMPFPGDD